MGSSSQGKHGSLEQMGQSSQGKHDFITISVHSIFLENIKYFYKVGQKTWKILYILGCILINKKINNSAPTTKSNLVLWYTFSYNLFITCFEQIHL